MLLYFSTITKLRAQTASVVGYLKPLSMVVFSVLPLGEVMSSLQIVNATMILLGALYAETRKLDENKKSNLP